MKRKLRSGVRRGPRGAQVTARLLPTAAGHGALRWCAGPARRAKRRIFAASGHDKGSGSGGVQSQSSSTESSFVESSSVESSFVESSSAESSSVARQRQQDRSRFAMPFAGVSVFTDGKLSSSTRSVVDAGAASGYHLVVVNGYSYTKKIPNGMCVWSRPFIVGGHRWCIHYFPNGFNSSCADYIGLFAVLLDDNVAEAVKVRFRFSLIDDAQRQDVALLRAAIPCNFHSNDKSWGESTFKKRDVLEQSKDLKNDCFTIRFDIMICEDLNTQDDGATEVPLSRISRHFNHLLQTKVGSDVIFEVSGETFAAHRCVLAARSTVFMEQLFGSLKEGTEADVIQIKDMKAEVFKALLSFIYTDVFPEMERKEAQVKAEATGFETWLQWLQDLIAAADRYDLQHLRFCCEELLCDVVLDTTTVPKMLHIAAKHHSHRLKEGCLRFLQNQSHSTLQTLMATNIWKHIIFSYPYLLKELDARLAAKCNASDNDNRSLVCGFLFPPSKK